MNLFKNLFNQLKKVFHFLAPLILIYSFWFVWLWCLVQFSQYDFNFKLDIWQVNLYKHLTIIILFCTIFCWSLTMSYPSHFFRNVIGILPLISVCFYLCGYGTIEERIGYCLIWFFFITQYTSFKYVTSYFREEEEKSA